MLRSGRPARGAITPSSSQALGAQTAVGQLVESYILYMRVECLFSELTIPGRASVARRFLLARAWGGHLDPEGIVLIVDDDPERVEAELLAGRMRCPDCGDSHGPWWFGCRRVLRDEEATLALRPRRARCHGCKKTHVMLPNVALARRVDTAAVIGRGLSAAARGLGHRKVAADLDRPESTCGAGCAGPGPQRVGSSRTSWLGHTPWTPTWARSARLDPPSPMRWRRSVAREAAKLSLAAAEADLVARLPGPVSLRHQLGNR